VLHRSLAALAIAAALAGPMPAQVTQRTTGSTDVPVRRVMLFSSGVGYFEHAGTVRGEGSTELRFKTTQINDILKSLVLQDLDGGRVTAITYPSQDPLAKTLRSFQVDVTANPSLADLLNQLRGAAVSVDARGERISGTILGVERRQTAVPSAAPVQTPVLNVIAGGTIRAVELQSVTSLSIDDAQLQAELTKALVALSQARDQDKKPVSIAFAGNGERRVRIGYVVETPVWKTSYRLLLDDKDHQLQGWAIVENQTEADWSNVSLSLVSGRPISFVMDLYQPLYAQRPTVFQEMFAGLRPQVYDGGLSRASVTAPPVPLVEQGVVGAVSSITAEGMAAGPVGGAGGRGEAARRSRLDSMASANELMSLTQSVQSVASAARLGELFQYTIGNVTLPRQQSAMLPIITDSINVERLSIYNASVLQKHPLNGVRLNNVTGKHLLQGPVTVLDKNNYAGDARLDNVPPGQQRLLSYGIDLEMVVDNTKNTNTNTILTGRISKGVLTIDRRLIVTREYLAENKSDRDKTLLIEHPIRAGWQLVDSPKPVETTLALYRFQGAAPAKKATTLTVKEEFVQGEAVALRSYDIGPLLTYSRTGEIPVAVRDAIARAVQLRQAVAETERQLNAKTQEIRSISDEQNRIRENMRTVSSSSQYYARLLAKLNEQESTIERLQREADALRATRDTQQAAVEDYVRDLTTE
jgi:hypothetical protein